jgi:hypothetical protein
MNQSTNMFLIEMIVVAAVWGALGYSIGHDTAPAPLTALCSSVKNVPYPGSIARDSRDLAYDIAHHKPLVWQRHEALVSLCELGK